MAFYLGCIPRAMKLNLKLISSCPVSFSKTRHSGERRQNCLFVTFEQNVEEVAARMRLSVA